METTELEKQVIALTSRVYELEQKVAKLSGENAAPVCAQPNVAEAPSESVSKVAEPGAPEKVDAPKPVVAEEKCIVAEPAVSDSPKTNESPAVEAASESLESKVGRKIMGVVASLLILLSIVLFGRLVYSNFTDGMKIAIMYGVSFAFAVFGIVKLSMSEENNTFYSCIAGCGMAGIYVSCLLTCFYFQMIDVLGLNGLLVLWLAVTCGLGKYVSRMFYYICNIGLIVASFEAVSCHQLTYGTVLYYIGVSVLYLIGRTRIFSKDCHFFTQMHVLSLIYAFGNYEHLATSILIAVFNIAAFIYAHFAYTKETSKDARLTRTNQVLLSGTCLIVLFASDFYVAPYELAVVALLNGILTAIQYLRYNLKTDAIWLNSYYVTLLLALCSNHGFFKYYTSFVPMCVLLLALTRFLGNKHFRYASFAFLLFTICNYPARLEYSYTLGFTLLFVIYYVYRYFRDSYCMLDKFLLSFMVLLSLCYEFVYYRTSWFICFVVLALLSLFFNTSLYRRDYQTQTEEKSTTMFSYLYNAVLLVTGVLMTLFYFRSFEITENFRFSESVVGAIIVILTLILSSWNIKHLYSANVSKNFFGIYTGAKLLVVLLAVLARLETVSLLVSLVCLVFTASCIAAGFKIGNKSLRLFGLSVTLIFVLKLILFDITYSSDYVRPLSFLGAGIVCFLISWFYSKLEKKH